MWLVYHPFGLVDWISDLCSGKFPYLQVYTVNQMKRTALQTNMYERFLPSSLWSTSVKCLSLLTIWIRVLILSHGGQRGKPKQNKKHSIYAETIISTEQRKLRRVKTQLMISWFKRILCHTWNKQDWTNIMYQSASQVHRLEWLTLIAVVFVLLLVEDQGIQQLEALQQMQQ